MSGTPPVISREHARISLLRHHYLMPPRSLDSQAGVAAVLDRVRCVQVDPINTVGTNANLVLQARVRNHQPSLLDQALYSDRSLIEGWDKLRSIFRTADWPYLNRFRQRMRLAHAATNQPPQEAMDLVLAEIARSGPLSSLDLPDLGKADWRWAPAKVSRAALDMLFDQGEIGVAGRVGSRKLYAMIADILPVKSAAAMRKFSRDPHEDDQAYVRWHTEQRVHSLGLAPQRAGDGWLGLRPISAADRTRALDDLTTAGRLVRVEIEGLKGRFHAPPTFGKATEQAGSGPAGLAAVTFIAPLDNLIWDRRLIRELFDFDYTWEVYKPAAKRQFGYYVLPVLFGDRFIARWEPRREDGKLVVRGFWWESAGGDLRDDPGLRQAFGQALSDFMTYLGVQTLRCERSVKKADREFLLGVSR